MYGVERRSDSYPRASRSACPSRIVACYITSCIVFASPRLEPPNLATAPTAISPPELSQEHAPSQSPVHPRHAPDRVTARFLVPCPRALVPVPAKNRCRRDFFGGSQTLMLALQNIILHTDLVNSEWIGRDNSSWERVPETFLVVLQRCFPHALLSVLSVTTWV